MSSEGIVALFGGTGILTTLSILYQIWRERRSNKQKDIAGDLALGELFRESATKAVADMQRDLDHLRETVAQLRADLDAKDQRIEALEDDWHECVHRFNRVVSMWPKDAGPPPV